MLGSLLGRREFSEGQNLGSYLGGSCTWSPWPWTPATSTFSILHWRQDRCLPLLQPRKSPRLGTKVMMSLLILSVFPRETAITWHFILPTLSYGIGSWVCGSLKDWYLEGKTTGWWFVLGWHGAFVSEFHMHWAGFKACHGWYPANQRLNSLSGKILVLVLRKTSDWLGGLSHNKECNLPYSKSTD